MSSHLCMPATLRCIYALISLKKVVTNAHKVQNILCNIENFLILYFLLVALTHKRCAGGERAFHGHPACSWLRCYFPLRYLALLQEWLNCLWCWTPCVTAWHIEESWNWHWLYINMLQLNRDFVSIWVMPAAGPEKSEVIGNKACCNLYSSFLQLEPFQSQHRVILVPQQLGRAFLTLEERETWEIKQSLTLLLSLPWQLSLENEWSSRFSACSGFSHVIMLNNISLQEHSEEQLGPIWIFRSV